MKNKQNFMNSMVFLNFSGIRISGRGVIAAYIKTYFLKEGTVDHACGSYETVTGFMKRNAPIFRKIPPKKKTNKQTYTTHILSGLKYKQPEV